MKKQFGIDKIGAIIYKPKKSKYLKLEKLEETIQFLIPIEAVQSFINDALTGSP